VPVHRAELGQVHQDDAARRAERLPGPRRRAPGRAGGAEGREADLKVSEVARRLGIEHPIIQGPFGGGLSTTKLASTVSNLGGLGSFGAHHLAPEEIGRVASELRSLTARPFALNLWVSNFDPGALDVPREQFDRAVRVLSPYLHELGLPLPE